MRTCVFDLETSGLYANSSIVLCAVIKEFAYDKPKKVEIVNVTPNTFKHKEERDDGVAKKYVIRADKFKSWETGKSDNYDVVKAIMDTLCGVWGDDRNTVKHDGFDIFVAHNGQYFDKAFLNSACLKYGLYPRLRFEKFIDPVLLSRRHMKMARNSLASLIDYFDIEEEKTPIRFDHWLKASLDGDKKSMDYIVEHCDADVDSLESVYRVTRKLVKGVDEKGSSY